MSKNATERYVVTEVLFQLPGKRSARKVCKTRRALAALLDKVRDVGGEILGFRDAETP